MTRPGATLLAARLRGLADPDLPRVSVPVEISMLLNDNARLLSPTMPRRRITKRLLTDLDRCEAMAIAPQTPAGLTHAMALGRLVDHAVAFALTRGTVDRPAEVSLAMAQAADDTELAELFAELDGFTPEDHDVLEVTNSVMSKLAAVRPTSVYVLPQASIEVPIGESVLLSGRFDVEFLRPGVPGSVGLLEVKSGSVRDEHRADGYWYALLAALRDGFAPAWVVGWSPFGGETVQFESGDGRSATAALVAAARRVGAAIGAIARLSATEHPLDVAHRRAGFWCGGCALGSTCPQAMRAEGADGA